MGTSNIIKRYFYISGVVTLFAGAFDPIEGSIAIVIGSLLLTLATYRREGSQWKFFLGGFVMILIGVISLFCLSSLGGFGGNSNLSWWLGLLILPYPLGWLMDVIVLVIRAYRSDTNISKG